MLVPCDPQMVSSQSHQYFMGSSKALTIDNPLSDLDPGGKFLAEKDVSLAAG